MTLIDYALALCVLLGSMVALAVLGSVALRIRSKKQASLLQRQVP